LNGKPRLARLAGDRSRIDGRPLPVVPAVLVSPAYDRFNTQRRRLLHHQVGGDLGAFGAGVFRFFDRREKLALKRGGDWKRVPLEEIDPATGTPPDLLAFDEALEQLTRLDATAGQLVKLSYFAGLSIEQAAATLNLSTATAYRHWTFGRAWLHTQVGGTPPDSSG
jgi:DNA-directed RNA polymerase specialized sigma24 family protein